MIKKISVSLFLSLAAFSDAFALQALLEEDNLDHERIQSHCIQRHREFSKNNPTISEIFWKLNVCFSTSNGFRKKVYEPLLDELAPHLQEGSMLKIMEEETTRTIASQNTPRISQSTNSSDATLTADEKEKGVNQLLEALSIGLTMAIDREVLENKKNPIPANPHEDTPDIAMASCQGTGIGDVIDLSRADAEVTRELSKKHKNIETFHLERVAPLFQQIMSLGQTYDIHCLDETVETWGASIISRAEELGLVDSSLPVQSVAADVRVYFQSVSSLRVLTILNSQGQPEKFPKERFLEVIAFFFEKDEEGTFFQKLASGTWSMVLDIERRENTATETKRTKGAWEVLRAISRGALLKKETYTERVNRMFVAYIETLHYTLSRKD